MTKKKSKKQWVKGHVQDKYVKLSKKENLKSRASYKLKQINEKYKVLKEGGAVIDLGAAPGGWSQVAKSIIKDDGLIIAIDLLDITGIKGIKFIRGDIFSDDVLKSTDDIIKSHGLTRVDLVMSDMAPNLTGIPSTDSARSYELTKRALFYAKRYLKRGGYFIVKLFRNEYYDEFLSEVKKSFPSCKIYKPDASRSKSSEIYLIAK
jgi:23S rRNA (uridine2552-2'-O)-methyltransferase